MVGGGVGKGAGEGEAGALGRGDGETRESAPRPAGAPCREQAVAPRRVRQKRLGQEEKNSPR
eukprot:scaffold21864_cov90-Isochrysis_galbana.AAC.1